ncbi:hypothetical protein Q4Q34_04880 [Flavivirga abyssicola]|uniref:hypothetical protein n=1 Tax=Flavivirga abyssicola TaxID=3063533 RepID=UPI0026E0938D|nr:hypothetical protein [Flavivirga sp. MEBiC07777]WVK14361.1 hypothetical protein Q4Q34_04880 [Flavivirga sp. MEBiC07777]
MKYIKLILILTFFSSCSTNKSIVGLYGKCGKSYFACTQIELKSDNTFEYFIFMDVGGENVLKGTWKKISNDTIVINTNKQPEFPKTTYTGKVNPILKGKVKIRISDKNGSLGASNVFINDRNQIKVADKNGIAEFEVDSIKNIEYGFLSQSEKIEVDNPNYNEIEILIKDLDLNAIPEFITNEKIILKRNKIIIDTNYVYKRTSLKNKQWK